LLHKPDVASAHKRSKTSRTLVTETSLAATWISEHRGCVKHKTSSAILGFDYIINLPSLGDDWVNVDRVIDRKTARKLRQLAAQTGANAVTVLERCIELFLAADEAKAKVIPFPNRSRAPS
jgi:hypothetical protein